MYNTAIGWESLYSLTTAESNTAVGNGALGSVTTGPANTGVGDGVAGRLTIGGWNTVIGKEAYNFAENTWYNTVIGGYAANKLAIGNENTIIGDSAGSQSWKLEQSVLIGGSAGAFAGANNLSSNIIVIGYAASPSSDGVDNEVTIGNANVSRFRIPGIGLDASKTSILFGAPIKEKWQASTALPTSGTFNFDVVTSPIVRLTSSTTSYPALNFRGDSSTTLSSILEVNESITVVMVLTNAVAVTSEPYSFYIDGVGVAVKWQGGSFPASGNSNATDVYTFVIQKVDSTPTYLVLASQTKFA